MLGITEGKMEIRHPRKGDVLPIPLEFPTYDPDWIWVYDNAVLIAGGAHDIVMLLRVIRFGEMPPFWFHRLLRHVREECRERGYRRYMVWLATDLYEEKKLFEIFQRYGAHSEPFRGDLVMGEI